jgi:ribosome-binding protein aMBF1 (putative translation factor)
MAAGTELGTRIKRARERRHWYQTDLAKAIGVNVKTVGNWERGRHIPRSRIGAIEETLGISLTEEPEPAEVYTDPVEAAIWELDLPRTVRLDFITQLRARRMKHPQPQEPPA